MTTYSIRRRPAAASCSERGYALLAVVLMCSALALLVASLVADVRADIRALDDFLRRTRAAAAGDAAIRLAARDLSERAERLDTLTVRPYVVNGRRVLVRTVPATGFIDINNASHALLEDMFVHGAGLARARARELATRLRTAHRPPHAPRGDDAAAASMRFAVPSDVMQFAEVDRDLFDRIERLITAYPIANKGVDPRAATDEVLLVISAGNRLLTERFARARSAREPELDTSGFTQPHLATTESSVYRLEALVADEAGAALVRAHWIAIDLPGWQPWRTLAVEPLRRAPKGF